MMKPPRSNRLWNEFHASSFPHFDHVAIDCNFTSISVTIRDYREIGSLPPFHATLELWHDEACVNLNLLPVCEVLPLSFQQFSDDAWVQVLVRSPLELLLGVSLLDVDGKVVEEKTGTIDREYTHDLFEIFKSQYIRGTRMEDTNTRTWEIRCSGKYPEIVLVEWDLNVE